MVTTCLYLKLYYVQNTLTFENFDTWFSNIVSFPPIIGLKLGLKTETAQLRLGLEPTVSLFF